MKSDLHWITGQSTSPFHAAAAIARDAPLADAQIAKAMRGPTAELSRLLRGAVPEKAFWQNVVPLSVGIESRDELARATLMKVPPDAAAIIEARDLSRRLSDLTAAFAHVAPGAADELSLRAGPLREAWQSRGPGLLRAVARLTDERLIPERADVVLVRPVLGGGGEAFPPHRLVTIEAMLANPHPQLPEVVRLGWLLTQLNLGAPVFAEQIEASRLPRVAALAMLPVVLSAAEDVELARCEPSTIEAALPAWHLANDSDEARRAELLDLLTRWWQTYCHARPPFAKALRALDEMLR